MRDKRRRGPSSQGPDEPGSKRDRLSDVLEPWAGAATANDNGWQDDDVVALDDEDQLPEFGDEATTLYSRKLMPQRSVKPARRPSARYRPPQNAPSDPSALRVGVPVKDEPRFALEGSLPRSLRPGASERARNTGVVVAGLLVIGLAALWSSRGPAWSRAMLSVSPHSSSIASSRTLLGQGHVVNQAPAPNPLHVAAKPEPATAPEPTPELDTPPPSAAHAALGQTDHHEVMEIALTEVPPEPTEVTTGKHGRTRRAHHAATHGRRAKAGHTKHGSLARPIRQLVETDEDHQEPVYYRAAVNEGTLQVNSRPWARVLVDGRFMGHTPQRALRLPPGRHRVQLVNEQLDMSKSFEVVITPGDVVTRVELLDESAHTSR